MVDATRSSVQRTCGPAQVARRAIRWLSVAFATLAVVPHVQAMAQDAGPAALDEAGQVGAHNPFTTLPPDDPRHTWIPASRPPSAAEIRAYPELFFEGNWHIEWRDQPDLSSADVWLLKGLMLDSACSLDGNNASCRDPAAPWTASGSRPGAGGTGSVEWHDLHVSSTPGDGTLKVEHAGGLTSLLRVANDDELVGTWTDPEGKTGTEIWHRKPRPQIVRVECGYEGAAAAAVDAGPCPVAVPVYPGQGAMRGNLPTVFFNVFGANLDGAGPLPVFIDWDKTSLEVQAYCYLYEKPFAEGQDHGCASWGQADATYGDIIGLRVEINVIYGAMPGMKTFWLGGVPVDFELNLPDLPEQIAGPSDGAEATLLRVVFTTPDPPFAPLDEVTYGERFRVKLVFDAAPPRDTEPVSLTTDVPDAAIQLDALQTDDPSLFLTEPVLLSPPETDGVAP